MPDEVICIPFMNTSVLCLLMFFDPVKGTPNWNTLHSFRKYHNPLIVEQENIEFLFMFVFSSKGKHRTLFCVLTWLPLIWITVLGHTRSVRVPAGRAGQRVVTSMMAQSSTHVFLVKWFKNYIVWKYYIKSHKTFKMACRKGCRGITG